MLTPILEPGGKLPLYEQLYRYVRGEIEGGRLKAHDKLASKRMLAEHLKISQITVETAYAQLIAEGYLYSRPKSGYFVQPLEPRTVAPLGAPLAAGGDKAPKPLEPEIEYDFSTDNTETEGFPFSIWAKLTRETLNENNQRLLQRGPSQGDYDLRRAIAGLLRSHRGIECRPGQIVVGAGTEYLLGLAVQLLGRNLVYAAEDPGYPKIHKILLKNGVKVSAIPMDAQGIELLALRASSAAAVHVSPSHQFPLGIIMPVSRRLKLLNWAGEKEGRYILEDDYDSEFRFAGRPIPALKTLDTGGRVIYFNTFAKSLSPSLRFGYMVLPEELLDKYRDELGFYSSTVSLFEQRTLFRFLSRGYFERHLNRMRKSYKTKRDTLIKALAACDKNGKIKVFGHNSGLHVLIRVDNGMNERELRMSALNLGVRVYGLSEYTSAVHNADWRDCIVLGYAGIPLDKISRAVELLARAWLKGNNDVR